MIETSNNEPNLNTAENESTPQKLLFISYYFPPTKNVAGSIRAESFVKNLPEFGWTTSVVALKEHASTETHAEVIRVKPLIPNFLRFHVTPYGWIGPLASRCFRLLRGKTYSAVYATLPPFPTAIALLALRSVSRTPLVVDLRDSWCIGPYQKEGFIERLCYGWAYPWLEKKLLQTASAVIVNTPSSYIAYRKTYPNLSTKIHHIPNGFDEADYVELPEPINSDGFVLLHCGPFGVSGRSPGPVLRALRSVVKNGHNIKLRVVGQSTDDLINSAIQYGVEDYVEIIPPVPHRAAVEHQMHCDALLLYQAHSTASISAVAGKTFEYIRSGRPILAITPNGDNRALIEKYCGFSIFGDSKNEDSIIKAIEKLVAAKKAGLLPISIAPSEDFKLQYERRELTKHLAEILNSVALIT